MVMENENALNAEEVAKILKIGRNAVYNMAKSGELTSYRIGRKLRFTYTDVLNYIEGSRGTGPTQSIASTPAIQPASSVDQPSQGFIIAGHDTLLEVLAAHSQKRGTNIMLTSMNSYDALHALYKNQISAACCHMYDYEEDEFNVPFVKRMLPGEEIVLILLAVRTQGFLVAKGNPLRINSLQDLTRPEVRFTNREKGSGVRIYLDACLKQEGIDKRLISGYDNEMTSEIYLAARISQGHTDVGIGRQQTAEHVNGVDFIPLYQEEYALVMKKAALELPEAKAILGIMASGELQEALSHTDGYDMSRTGRYTFIGI